MAVEGGFLVQYSPMSGGTRAGTWDPKTMRSHVWPAGVGVGAVQRGPMYYG